MICLFRSKNSETLISRCFFASSSAIEIDGIPSQGTVEDNGGRSHPWAPRIWACPFKVSLPVSQCHFYGGKGTSGARVEVGESVRLGWLSLLENGPALRALLGALVDVGAAVRAREGGGLGGFLALRRSGFRRLWLRRLLWDLRLRAEHPGARRPRPDRVPPHEQDHVVERERQDHRERGEVDEQAVEVRAGRGQRAEVEARQRPVLVPVPDGEAVSIDLAGEIDAGFVPRVQRGVGEPARARAEGHPLGRCRVGRKALKGR